MGFAVQSRAKFLVLEYAKICPISWGQVITQYTGNSSPDQNSASASCVSGRLKDYKMASMLCLRCGPTDGRCWEWTFPGTGCHRDKRLFGPFPVLYSLKSIAQYKIAIFPWHCHSGQVEVQFFILQKMSHSIEARTRALFRECSLKSLRQCCCISVLPPNSHAKALRWQ